MRCGISFPDVLSKLELLLSVLSGNAYLSPPIALTAPSQIFCGIIFQPGIEISSIATDQVSCNCLEFRKKNSRRFGLLHTNFWCRLLTSRILSGSEDNIVQCHQHPTLTMSSPSYHQLWLVRICAGREERIYSLTAHARH